MFRSLALCGVLLFAGLGLAVPGAQAQRVPTRRLGVDWSEGVPTVHASVTDLASREVRRKLDSGLPQTLVLRVYAYGEGGNSLAVAAQSCRVTYDLWQEVYRVERADARGDRSETVAELDGVLERCLVLDRIAVGRARDYARVSRVYFAVLVELNPLSSDTVQRLRRWLARPAGGGRVGGEAFFGSFVSLFVNRRIGSAERTLRFRSQTVRVER